MDQEKEYWNLLMTLSTCFNIYDRDVYWHETTLSFCKLCYGIHDEKIYTTNLLNLPRSGEILFISLLQTTNPVSNQISLHIDINFVMDHEWHRRLQSFIYQLDVPIA